MPQNAYGRGRSWAPGARDADPAGRAHDHVETRGALRVLDAQRARTYGCPEGTKRDGWGDWDPVPVGERDPSVRPRPRARPDIRSWAGRHRAPAKAHLSALRGRLHLYAEEGVARDGQLSRLI